MQAQQAGHVLPDDDILRPIGVNYGSAEELRILVLYPEYPFFMLQSDAWQDEQVVRFKPRGALPLLPLP